MQVRIINPHFRDLPVSIDLLYDVSLAWSFFFVRLAGGVKS
jgi:hypothetical protein